MPDRGSLSALFLSANTPWVYALAQSLARSIPVTAVRSYDWVNYVRLRPQWPEVASSVSRVSWTMPPGYVGAFSPAFSPLMKSMVDQERRTLLKKSGDLPLTICPYPYLTPWVRHVPQAKLVYYNLDEYRFYEPSKTVQILRLERELVQRAGLTLCLSLHQVNTLRERYPFAESRIRHFPLGVVPQFINPEPGAAPLPKSVGYVGNLTNRVDWSFVAAVARQLPEITFYFVGRLDVPGVATTELLWRKHRDEALALANVCYVGEVAQPNVHEHYWRYSVNWMPYDVKNEFNIAACPTKIMDALASGRPFVSTPVPEIRLYPDHVACVNSPSEAVALLQRIFGARVPHDATRQVEFAASNTWDHKAREFLDIVEEALKAFNN